MENMLRITEVAENTGLSKAILFTLTRTGLITAVKVKNKFYYSVETLDILAKYLDKKKDSTKHLTSEGFVEKVAQWWNVEPFKYIGTEHDVTATCKQCGVTSTKRLKKYLEAADKNKSGCLACYKEYTKSEEFARKMGEYSAPANSEPRMRQRKNLAAFHKSKTTDELKKIYGHEPSPGQMEARLQGFRDWYNSMTEEERHVHWCLINRKEDKKSNHVDFMKKWWNPERRQYHSSIIGDILKSSLVAKAAIEKRRKSKEHKAAVRSLNESTRWHNDPLYNAKQRLRSCIRRRLHNHDHLNNTSHTCDLMGADWEFVYKYLCGTATGNPSDLMKLSIDHICPCSQAQSIEELQKLQHYSNLRLISQSENSSKSDSWTQEGEELCRKLLGRDWIDTH